MKSAILGLLIGAVFSSSAFAAGYCSNVPPNQKFKCCQKHPNAAACR